VGYGDYQEQLTYPLFLKMAHEYAQEPYRPTPAHRHLLCAGREGQRGVFRRQAEGWQSGQP
jgi:hypothetical protein